MTDAVQPFRIAIPQADLDDLRARLARTRFPDRETPDDWSQGIPLAYVQELVAYWKNAYDWRACEARLNALPQFTTRIDGLNIHFLHVRSPHANAKPLVLTHGWPGSILEFMKVIGPLTDPVAHGGDAADAFHLVCPTLPGFGFSEKPTKPGWNIEHIADAWSQLMQRLGYSRYFAQGGDWGAIVTAAIGVRDTAHCAAIHMNMPIAPPDPAQMDNLTAREQSALAGMKHYQDWDSGYSKQQATRPQTLGYALADSPAGQMAWIVEKFWSWMDCDGHPENILTRDELLDNVMMYWLTNAGASSGRIYWESFARTSAEPISIPVGCSIFPKEIFRTSRRWAEKRFSNIVHFNELDKGGHFAAMEQPASYLDEVRTCFRQVR